MRCGGASHSSRALNTRCCPALCRREGAASARHEGAGQQRGQARAAAAAAGPLPRLGPVQRAGSGELGCRVELAQSAVHLSVARVTESVGADWGVERAAGVGRGVR